MGRFGELAGALADRWAARGARGPVELQQELSELSLRMICEYALGGIGAEDSADVVGAFETVLTEHLGRMYRPAGSPEEEARGLARADDALDFLRATVDRVLAVHHAGGAHAEGRSDLIATLADAGVGDARVRDTVLMIMLAAHHTTGVSVSWTLYLLGRHPDVAERVVREIDAVLGDRDAPDYGDLRRMDYLDMVVKEAMRLYTPGPYGARETAEPIEVGDYTVPAGATVFYPFWAIHLNPAYWPDPHTFDPERFTAERSAGRPHLAYVPFGLGPRSCEGAALAMVEAKLVLAVLLRRLSFTPAPGPAPTPVERFVLWAADGITMRVAPRAG
jgi:cytochrome P450